MKAKKLFMMLLAVLMLLCLAACNGGKPADTTGATNNTDPEPTGPLVLFDGSASNYKIIFSDNDDEFESSASLFKRLFREKTGVDLEAKSDWNIEEATHCEVVIGEANRENTQLTEAMKTSIYKDGFVIMAVGHRLWICGENGESTSAGVQYFFDKIATGDTIQVEEGFLYAQYRQQPTVVQSLNISGNNIADYAIVCKTSIKTIYSVAEKLQEEIWDQTGYCLPIRDVSENVSKKITLDMASTSGVPFYSVKNEDGNLVLSGSDKDYLSETVNYIAREYFGKRKCYWASKYYYEPSTATPAIDSLNVTVAYNRIDTLTIGGKNISEFVIMYDKENSTSSTAYAASELYTYLYNATGKKLSIDKTNALVNKPMIKLVYDKEMGENYSIKTTDAGLVITGGERGILYGVYNFLEDYVGWSFLPYGTDLLVTEEKTVAIDNIDVEYEQYFEYRAAQFQSEANADFAVKNMLNSKFGKNGTYTNMGGFYGFTGGHVHTIMALLGDDSHAASVGPNPCVYNEDNYRTILANIRKMLKENPDAQIISVSATDSAEYCQCVDCTGKSIGGNQTDAWIKFVNSLADEIKDEYPNVKLHMLGYGHTYTPPKKIKANDNVIVQLANIGCCFQHPLEDECCAGNKRFMKNLKEWSKWADNLYMWDYATDFLVFMPTFPNFDVLRQNIQTFYKYGVKGVFEQGDMNNIYSKFEELESYLLAKLCENPYMTEEEYDKLIDAFIVGYYGEGGTYIRQYYDFLMEASNKRDQHFGIYAQTEWLYDMNDFIERGAEVDEWFDKAMAAATTDDQLYHIRCLRISYKYMKLWLTYDYIKKNGTNEELLALDNELVATFDDMVREAYRTQDTASSLGDYINSVSKLAHPRWWNPRGHIWDAVEAHGIPGMDENFNLKAGDIATGEDM